MSKSSQSRPITPEGLERLTKELRILENQTKISLIKEIEYARGHGDLSENAEYHSAKERLRLVQKRIQDLQQSIASAQVIDVRSLSGKKIMFGATVQLFCHTTQKTLKYQIVGDDESDISQGKIAIFSALARGLIGKQEGDKKVLITTPGGKNTYDILSVQYI